MRPYFSAWQRILLRRNIIRLHQTDSIKHDTPSVTTLKINLSELTKVSISNSIIANKEDLKISQKVEKIKNPLPPSLQHVRKVMDAHKDNVVLTQMGSFYELYFEHATKYAPKLNISLTSKNYNHGKVAFAGFPLSQLNRHLKVLVNQFGYSVTIVDQFKNDNMIDNDPNRFSRRVTRIVTPGTFIDEAFENFKENSYLLNIEFPSKCMDKLANSDTKLGLCWCDVSTGEIFVQEVLLKDLASAITRIRPREIILNDELIKYEVEKGKWYPELVELKKYFIKFQTLPSQYHTIDMFDDLFFNGSSDFTKKQLDHKFKSLTQKELAALRNILEYVNDHLPNCSINFQIPERQSTTSIMQIDSRTNSALELHSTMMNNGKKGSLLSTIRRTVTPIGTRLLTQWLSAPSLDLAEIKERQALVKFFKENNHFTNQLIINLKTISDLSRILQKFSFGRGNALELIQISKSLKTASDISIAFQEIIPKSKKTIRPSLINLANKLEVDMSFVNLVLKSLNEDKIMIQEKSSSDELLDEINTENERTTKMYSDSSFLDEAINGAINPECSPKLKGLYDDYKSLLIEQEQLESSYASFLSETFGTRKVILKQRQNGDYVIYVYGSSSSLNKLSDWIKEGNQFNSAPFQILQQSNQTRWLSHKLWTDIAYKLELTMLKIKKEEGSILNSFKNQLVEKSNEVRIINTTLGYLDTLSSFAKLAEEKSLVCPKVDNSLALSIVNGRHLMVEEGITSKSLEKFVANDCQLDNGSVWLITGPNMGGKSTFLRQNAIIVILAQIGSFVPCDSAHIGLVDKIFSRVGSADDLYNEMSTFMVEMIETSFILRGATNRSLAIVDEIGRGTSGKEGVSIAYATLNYIAKQNQCRTLFATHFGEELQKFIECKPLEILYKKVRFFQSKIVEVDRTNFYYDYKMRPGICTKSDAIKVAQLAGFPESALIEAENLLSGK